MMAEAKILSMTAGRELIMGKVECKVCGCTEVRRDTDGLHPHHIWRWTLLTCSSVQIQTARPLISRRRRFGPNEHETLYYQCFE